MKRAARARDGLERIPSCVLGKILGSLCIKDAFQARCVCKAYRKCKPQWSVVELKKATNGTIANVKADSVPSCLLALVLQFNLDPDQFVDINGFSSLQTLVFHQCDFRPAANHVASIASLRHLTLDRVLISSECYIPLRALSLETLVITSSRSVCDQGLAHIAHIASLKSLTLPFGAQYTDLGIAHLVALKHLDHLDVQDGFLITDVGARSISLFTNVRYLTLRLAPISNAGLSHFAQLVSLMHLNVSACGKINALGLQSLGQRTILKHLNLGGCPKVCVEGIAHLQQLSDLEHLDVSHSKQFTDKACAYLACFKKLKHLNLFCTAITDTGLSHVRALTNLTHFLCGFTEITGAGLVHVSGLTRLELLDIRGCQVRDADLHHLFQIKTFCEVDVHNCKHISQRGVDALICAIGGGLKCKLGFY